MLASRSRLTRLSGSTFVCLAVRSLGPPKLPLELQLDIMRRAASDMLIEQLGWPEDDKQRLPFLFKCMKVSDEWQVSPSRGSPATGGTDHLTRSCSQQDEAQKLLWRDVSEEGYPGALFGEALTMLEQQPKLATYVRRIANPGRHADYTGRILAILPLLTNVKNVRGLIWDQVQAPKKRRKSKPRVSYLSVVVNLVTPTARLGDFFDLSELDRFGLHLMSPSVDFKHLLREVPRTVHEFEMTTDTIAGVQIALEAVSDRAGLRVLHLEATDRADGWRLKRRVPLSPNPLQLFPELRILRLRCFDPTSILTTAHSKLTYLTLGPLACDEESPLEVEDRYDSDTEPDTSDEEDDADASEEEEAVESSAEAVNDDGSEAEDDGSEADDENSDAEAAAPRARRNQPAVAVPTEPFGGDDNDDNEADGDDEQESSDETPAPAPAPPAPVQRFFQRRAAIPPAWAQHMSSRGTGFGPDSPIRVAASRVARIHRAAPNQFPSLLGVGFIPGPYMLFSFEAWARRRLEGIRPMARALRAARLTLLDQDGERWKTEWFDEVM